MRFAHRPALDGLRALAVVLVVLFHAGIPGLGGGFIGVDVFFVLSGFLVTQVVLGEIEETGRLRLGAFYARRVRRLLPAAVVVVVATVAVFVAVTDVVRRLPLVGDAQAALLYAANWRFLATSDDYFAADNAPSPFLHFWSLSIEEQFYLAFPVVLVLLTRLARRRGVLLPAGLAVLLGLSLAAQLSWSQVDPSHAFYGTDARLYQLVAGALLAATSRRTPRPAARDRWAAAALPVAGIVLLGVLASDLLTLTPTWRGLGATVGATALIAGLVAGPVAGPVAGSGRWVGRALSRPLPVYVGTISYGIYLWHWPVLLVVRSLVRLGPVSTAMVVLVVSAGLASLSFQVLETPVRRSRSLDRFRWRGVVAGLAASVLVAGLLVPPVLHSTRRPVLVSSGMFATVPRAVSAEGRQPVPADIDFASVSGQEAPGRTCTAADPQACVVVRGRGPHLLLVGDSQAMMLGPMLATLAREHDFTFSENAMSGCSWVSGLPEINPHASAAVRRTCVQSRGDWYADVLPRLRPDVVLLVQRPREGATRPVEQLAGSRGPEPLLDRLTRQLDRTLAVVTAGPQKVLLLESVLTPRPFPVVQCLASASTVGECPVPLPRATPYSDALYRSAALHHADVWTANINRVVCPQGPTCLGVRDHTLVWRDRDHLTVDFTMRRRAQIWAALRESGALAGFG